MKKDELTVFLEKFLAQAPVIGHVPAYGGVSNLDKVVSVVMFRMKPMQVQMFIVPPYYIIPAHTHPNVDSYEVYVGGTIKFSHNGKFVIDGENVETNNIDKTNIARGRVLRVHPNDRHGGVFGAGGGVFLSVQHWLNGVEPHCVARDYIGPSVGKDHFDKVKAGKPTLRMQEELTEQDAL